MLPASPLPNVLFRIRLVMGASKEVTDEAIDRELAVISIFPAFPVAPS